MRHSSAFFLKTLTLSLASALLLSACANTTSNTRKGPDPFDNYYGSPAGINHQAGIIVNPSAPQSYVVKRGDTLWRIARMFLHTPWHWPEIWDKNQNIPNPHLIYPGDVLHLDYQGGNGNKLTPRIRIDRRGTGEPISTLSSFMLWPRVLDEATIKNAPYVLASRDDRTLITEGETIYVERLRNAQPGTRCAIFHPKKPLYDPRNNQLLGYEVDYAGYSRIERLGKPATATVLEAQREIRKGDRLFIPLDDTANLHHPILAPNFKVRADVISLFDASYYSGNYMTVVINRGSRDRLRPGHVLGAYTQGKQVVDPLKSCAQQSGNVCTDLPPEKVANVVLYKVNERVSYGLVMDASREVRDLDKIGNP